MTKKYRFTAYDLYEILKLKEIARALPGNALSPSSTKLVYRLGDGSYCFIYRFGSVVFFDVPETRQKEIVETIVKRGTAKQKILSIDHFSLRVDPGAPIAVGFEEAVIDRLELDRIDLLALVLAQSAGLEYFEWRVDEMLESTGEIAERLRKQGRLVLGGRAIRRLIGQCIASKQELVASLYLLDKPDEAWNDELLDNLYREAIDMFELRDRYRTVDYKLRMVQENLELI